MAKSIPINLSHLSAEDQMFLAEIAEQFGSGHTHQPPDAEDMVLAKAILPLRTALKEAFAESGMTIRGLAEKMAVKPSVISRFFKAEGDMKVSTAALVAHYVGASFHAVIRKDQPRKKSTNYSESVYVMSIEHSNSHRMSNSNGNSFEWDVPSSSEEVLEDA